MKWGIPLLSQVNFPPISTGADCWHSSDLFDSDQCQILFHFSIKPPIDMASYALGLLPVNSLAPTLHQTAAKVFQQERDAPKLSPCTIDFLKE